MKRIVTILFVIMVKCNWINLIAFLFGLCYMTISKLMYSSILLDDGFQSKKELARTPIKSNTSRVSQQQHQLQHTPITMKNFNDESSCRRVTPATPGTPALDFDDGDQILLENMTPIHKLSTYSSPCLDLVGGTNTDGGVGASDVDEFELLADIQAPPTSLVDSPLSTPSHTKSRKNVSSTRNGTGSPLIPFQDSTTTSLTAASVIARAAKHLSRAAPSSSSSTLIDLLQTPPRQSNINNNSNNNNNNSTSLRKSVLKNRIVKNTLTDLDCTAPMSQSSSSMIDQSSGSTSSSNAAMEEENLILLSPFVQYNRAMDMMGYEDKENMKETSNFDGSMLLLDEFERDISTDNSHSGEDKVINSSNSNNNITNSSLKFDGLSPIKKDLGDTARVVVVDGGGVGLEGSSTSIPSFNLLLEGTNSNDLINLDSMVLMETQNLENLLPFSSSTTTTTTAAAVKRMSIDAKSLIMYADQKSGVFVGSGGHEMGDDVLHPADLISILHMDATDFPVQLHLTKQAEGADADISLLS